MALRKVNTKFDTIVVAALSNELGMHHTILYEDMRRIEPMLTVLCANAAIQRKCHPRTNITAAAQHEGKGVE